METFSALLALCGGNLPVTGGFPSQRPLTRNFDIFWWYDLRPNEQLSKQSGRRWFETPSCSLWRHCSDFYYHRHSLCYMKRPVIDSRVILSAFYMTPQIVKRLITDCDSSLEEHWLPLLRQPRYTANNNIQHPGLAVKLSRLIQSASCISY